VRSSHERFDGTGYPDGLCARDTEVGARIIAICDAYDAMVSSRVYRKLRSHEDALAELGRCAGTQVDPMIVELFRSTVEERDEQLACAT
jgi:HD-GYP domain-containing protein (c-di-GMP phosphodiesterase class II)